MKRLPSFCLSFHHYVEEVNKIYLVFIKLLGYQISLTSCTKWQNNRQAIEGKRSKLSCGTRSLFWQLNDIHGNILFGRNCVFKWMLFGCLYGNHYLGSLIPFDLHVHVTSYSECTSTKHLNKMLIKISKGKQVQVHV